MKYFYNIKPVKLIKVQCQNIKHSFLSNLLRTGRMQHISFAGPKLPEVFKICRTLFHLWCSLPCSGRCLPPPTLMAEELIHSLPAKHATHPWKLLASSHSCLNEIQVSVTHWHYIVMWNSPAMWGAQEWLLVSRGCLCSQHSEYSLALSGSTKALMSRCLSSSMCKMKIPLRSVCTHICNVPQMNRKPMTRPKWGQIKIVMSCSMRPMLSTLRWIWRKNSALEPTSRELVCLSLFCRFLSMWPWTNDFVFAKPGFFIWTMMMPFFFPIVTIFKRIKWNTCDMCNTHTYILWNIIGTQETIALSSRVSCLQYCLEKKRKV